MMAVFFIAHKKGPFYISCPKLAHILVFSDSLLMSYITANSGIIKYIPSRRSRVVYTQQIRQRSVAEWCMHVSGHTPRSEAELCML